MNRTTPFTLTAAIGLPLAAVFSWWAGVPAMADETQPAPAPAGEEQAAAPADNSGCFVCHTDYEEEPLVQVHFEENIGCIDCHGESQDHADDEEHSTPPDVMFSPAAIAAACKECHKSHDAPPAKVVQRWQKRCPKEKDPAELVCTDCHGRHRLEKRKVRWDKQSGKLIDDE